MQDNTTHEISTLSMEALDGHVLEQAAFHTQISYNLCHHVTKILLQSYLQERSTQTISWFCNS
jgi:hypothetical protein